MSEEKKSMPWTNPRRPVIDYMAVGAIPEGWEPIPEGGHRRLYDLQWIHDLRRWEIVSDIEGITYSINYTDGVHNPSVRRKKEKNNVTEKNNQSVLLEAEEVVNDRMASYGTPKVNHERTAAMWNAFLSSKLAPGQKLTAADVCQLNALQKISREANAHKRDNLVDVCGYIRNAQLCGEK